MKRQLDLERAKRGIEEFLRGLGYDPNVDSELANTSSRVVDAWTRDLLAGEAIDVPTVLREHSSPAGSGEKGIVVLRNLSTVAVCPHHLMPAIGTATVLYVPGQRIAGLGAIARVVDAFARRLVLQEVIGEQVARALVEHLGGQGRGLQDVDAPHVFGGAGGAQARRAHRHGGSLGNGYAAGAGS